MSTQRVCETPLRQVLFVLSEIEETKFVKYSNNLGDSQLFILFVNRHSSCQRQCYLQRDKRP